jgi:F1F0 ATPase subunit 2
MNETLIVVLAGVAGWVLGAIFFGGLWWTVRRGLSSKQPALWFLGSLIVRMGIALPGFYFVGRGHWARLVACLIGFIFARIVVTGMTRLPRDKQTCPAREVSDAP